MSKKKILRIIFGFFPLVFLSHSLFGLTVLQLNLEQITALAEKVFVGRCVSVKEGKDPSGRLVQWVTFEVDEMLKGEEADRITFKQLASDGPQMAELPGYREGEAAIIFLSEESRLGFTAPIGLAQGKFEVKEGTQGKTVVNGLGNRGLFIHWKKSPRYKSMVLSSSEKKLVSSKAGAVPYDDFVSVVRKLSTP